MLFRMFYSAATKKSTFSPGFHWNVYSIRLTLPSVYVCIVYGVFTVYLIMNFEYSNL